MVGNDPAKDDADHAILVVLGDQGAAILGCQPARNLSFQVLAGVGFQAPQMGIGCFQVIL